MANFDEREDSDTTVVPARPPPVLTSRAETPTVAARVPAPPRASDARGIPAWVVAYLLLCAGLTLIGLVVLFFEPRMLGHGSPP
jgi:hypothetical protein